MTPLKLFRRPLFYSIIFALTLVSFTAFVLLDTFVISRPYAVAQSKGSALTGSGQLGGGTQSGGTNNNLFTDKVVTTATSYSDPHISISVSEYRKYDTTIYVADVYLSDPQYLKTALAKNTYGKNVTDKTSVTAAASSSILAVNGDYYGARTKGYVIRDGVLYRSQSAGSDQEDVVIWSSGSLSVIREGDITAEELLNKGAEQVLSFGPGIIENGKVTVSENSEVNRAMTSNPRTAIGIIDKLHYLFVVSDGRTNESVGLTLYQLAGFMLDLHATCAYNLDGGGSSTMYFNGELINNPTTDGRSITERSVSDIVYIG